jgi:hypothetical protein
LADGFIMIRYDCKTWEKTKVLEDNPTGWYCYTAVEFVGEHILLAHCAVDRRTGGLNTTQITRFSLSITIHGACYIMPKYLKLYHKFFYLRSDSWCKQ